MYEPKHKKILDTPRIYNQLLKEYDEAGMETGLPYILVTVKPKGTISKLSAMSTGVHPIFRSTFFRSELVL